MNPHDQRIIHSSEDPDWRTPVGCYEALDQEFFFEIDLAADARSRLAQRWLGPGGDVEDALEVDWAMHADSLGVAPVGFLNPPFSRTLAAAYRTGRIKRDGVWVPHERNPAKARAYEIEAWAEKCWRESQLGCMIVGLFPFAPQTEWYRSFVCGHTEDFRGWSGHAAQQERRLPHRISFLRPDGSPAANAGVNTAVIVWSPMRGAVGPWAPHSFYWSYR